MEGKSKKGLVIAVIVVILVLILGFVFLGIRGLFKIFKWLMITLLILAIIGFVVWGVWYLFIRKERFDVTHVNKTRLIESCHRGNTGLLKGLFLSGDKGHSKVFWGKITGWCRITVPTNNIKLKIDEKGDTKPSTVLNKFGDEEIEYIVGTEEQDVFSVSTAGNWFMRLFEEEKVVRVRPDLHDDLVGDVTIDCFSLVLVGDSYFFPNNSMLDVRITDYAILFESKRSIAHEQMKDFKTIVDRASGLDTEHQKRIDEKSIFEVPVSSPVRTSR